MHVTQRRLFASMDEQRAIVEQAAVKTKLARRDQERTRRALRAPAKDKVVGPPEPAAPDEADIGPILPFEVEEWS